MKGITALIIDLNQNKEIGKIISWLFICFVPTKPKAFLSEFERKFIILFKSIKFIIEIDPINIIVKINFNLISLKILFEYKTKNTGIIEMHRVRGAVIIGREKGADINKIKNKNL